jgi:hypothetical protein
MAKSTYTLFGTLRQLEWPGENSSVFYNGHLPVWEKDNELFVFYQNQKEPSPFHFKKDEGYLASDHNAYFMRLMVQWASGDDSIPQNLNHPGCENLLLAWKYQKPDQRTQLRLHLSAVRHVSHPALQFLANPALADPEKTFWGGFGMPHGQIIVGPWEKLMDELDALRRNSWNELPDEMKQRIAITLHEERGIPREYRVDALRIFYEGMRTLGESNARSNAISWARMYFGLADDPMALPWVR